MHQSCSEALASDEEVKTYDQVLREGRGSNFITICRLIEKIFIIEISLKDIVSSNI